MCLYSIFPLMHCNISFMRTLYESNCYIQNYQFVYITFDLFIYIYIYIYILHPQTLIYLFNQLILEQLHQSTQNFCLFCQKKPTISILQTNFYKILTSVCLFYNIFYLNNHFPKFFNYLSQLSLSLSVHSQFETLSIHSPSETLSPFMVTSNDPPWLKLADPQAPIRHKHQSKEICSSLPKHSNLLQAPTHSHKFTKMLSNSVDVSVCRCV